MSSGRERVRRPEKVPAVAGNVEKNDDTPVGLDAFVPDELDPGRHHPRNSTIKVFYAQEETNPTGKLMTDDCLLLGAIGSRE